MIKLNSFIKKCIITAVIGLIFSSIGGIVGWTWSTRADFVTKAEAAIMIETRLCSILDYIKTMDNRITSRFHDVLDLMESKHMISDNRLDVRLDVIENKLTTAMDNLETKVENKIEKLIENIHNRDENLSMPKLDTSSDENDIQ